MTIIFLYFIFNSRFDNSNFLELKFLNVWIIKRLLVEGTDFWLSVSAVLFELGYYFDLWRQMEIDRLNSKIGFTDRRMQHKVTSAIKKYKNTL